MYKSNFARTCRLVSILCALCISIAGQDWKAIHPGVEHAQVEHKIGNEPVKINLLRLDLTKVRIDVHHAFEKAIGVEPTSEIAIRNAAIAAINAGFFRLDKSEFAGDPAGVLMIDGRLMSESERDRTTLVASNLEKQTHIFFGHYATETWIRLGDDDRPIPLSGINRERKKGDAVIYDSGFKQKFERQEGDVEIRLGKCTRRKFDRSSDRLIDCKDVEILRDQSDSPKLTTEFVILMDKEFVASKAVSEKLNTFQNVRKRRIIIGTRMKDGSNYFAFTENVDVTNGVPQLIKNSKIDITWEQEKASKSFAEMRHPRTAVAKLKDGKFLMITVDGRQPGVSVGMNLQELAEYLLSLGATDAMNLDGGGSTTMFLDGKVVNTPSDKEGERKVSDAIVVTLRKNPRR